MSEKTPKMPNPNAVKELREKYNQRKEERRKKHSELAETWKKGDLTKKIAKNKNNLPDLPDVEL